VEGFAEAEPTSILSAGRRSFRFRSISSASRREKSGNGEADRGFYEVLLTTTLPPQGAPKRLGVFAYSDTPDPVPGNNYAERTLP
jgi:hypothetical protein